MHCERCGAKNPDNAAFCAECGSSLVQTPPPLNAKLGASPKAEADPTTLATPSLEETAEGPTQEPEARYSHLAGVSFLLGLLTWIYCLFWLTGIPAVIFGVFAIRVINRHPERLKGNGFAIAGVVLGALSVQLIVFFNIISINIEWLYQGPQNRSKCLQAEQSMQALSTALEAYRLDNGAYPPRLAPHLTTPVAHISGVPVDRFSKEPFAYYQKGEGWILISRGPDGYFEMSQAEDYDPELRDNPALIHKTYDATNGTRSAGDIFLTKENSEQSRE
jgi:hypothetical protein